MNNSIEWISSFQCLVVFLLAQYLCVVVYGIIGEEEKKKTIDKLNQVLEDSAWGKVKMIY